MNVTRAMPAGHAEPQGGGMASRLNWLRAAVLGANDGIVSTALGIDPRLLARPGYAAAASFLSFTAGALLPLLAITLMPGPARIAVTVIAVLAALVATGAASAALGRARRGPAVLRNVIGGAIAMGVTYGIGTIIGAAGI